ncbi:electron transfer flavoprotein subunit alpha/FixB family protein [Corynebacterium mendelii]|uniref:Electron transfer flavoprotein subunit alpha/FixB family protein n=1 Tax=Corynebacterium mendelii TaxID=2765362 RepID=A0A939E201_9CORY|nr:electron transfer flavoprotein subunit alpha/FixB family protein [Corynebacterium mendelii]MBN9644969.1 electron transfer flavoprotein subunit alpha/FixB family protein [Corynebacterium mendelii]
MTNTYVLVQHQAGRIDGVTAELITAAAPLGDVWAVVTGSPGTAAGMADELAALGAVTIVAAESADAASRVVLPEVDALSILAADNPGPVVVAAGATGNEIAGRVAARVASGVLCDVVGINADRTANLSVLGDTYQVSAAVGGDSPVYTLRPGAVDAQPVPAAGDIVELAMPQAGDKDVTVASFTPAIQQARPDLAQAKTVVAGGRGVGSREGFETLLEPLADSLGGAVGCTRDAVDEDYYGAAYQIGQTGVTCSPELYIGFGISGAIQHKAGMQTARTIVCVNNDEDAPLFDIADFGVVGDLAEIAPKLTAEITRRTGK